MENPLKELINYGAVGLLATLACSVVVVLWKHVDIMSKTIKENTDVNRQAMEERKTAASINSLLIEQLQEHLSHQTRHNQAILEALVNLTRK